MGFIGERGYDWSRTTSSSTSAYDLDLRPTNIYISSSAYHYYAFPSAADTPTSSRVTSSTQE